jgi:integrase
VLNREEITRLEDAAQTERGRLIIRVLADTCLRLSELLGLVPEGIRQELGRRWHLKVRGKGERSPDSPGRAAASVPGAGVRKLPWDRPPAR